MKSADEVAFNNCIKILLSYKASEITMDILIEKLEEILKNYPEFLDDAFLFLDYKRVIQYFKFFFYFLFFLFLLIFLSIIF